MRIELDDCLATDRRRLKSLLRDLKSAQGEKKEKARADFDAHLRTMHNWLARTADEDGEVDEEL